MKQQPKQVSPTVTQSSAAWQHHQQQSKTNTSSITSVPLTNAEEVDSVKSPTVATSAASNAKSVTVTRKGTRSTTQTSSQQHTDVAKQLVKAIHKEKENQQVSERQLLSLSMTASLTGSSQQQQTSWPELLSQDEQKAIPLEQQRLASCTFHSSVSRSPLQAAPLVSMPPTTANPVKAANYTQALPTTAAQATPTIMRVPNVTVISGVNNPSSASVVASTTTSRVHNPSFSVPTSAVRVVANLTSSTLSNTIAPVTAVASSVALPTTTSVTTPPHVVNPGFNLEMPLVQLPQPPFHLYVDGENKLFFKEYGKMVSMCVAGVCITFVLYCVVFWSPA